MRSFRSSESPDLRVPRSLASFFTFVPTGTLSSDQLKSEAIAAWHDYGDAIVEAFHFPAGSRIDDSALAGVIKRGDDASLKALTAYARKQAAELRNAKFVGEK